MARAPTEKGHMSERQSSATIDDAAAAWVARIDRAPLTPDESDELDAWLAADFRRQGAFAKARAVMVFIDRAGILGSGSRQSRLLHFTALRSVPGGPQSGRLSNDPEDRR